MSLDIVTTNYALSNGLGYEGNNLMSGVASNLNYLIMVKFIGSMVIIMLMKNIIQKNENMAKIGMRIIIFLMLFVVSNNLFVINAYAVSFSPFTGSGTPGSINTGNGFYDNDGTAYGYTGQRNVYIVTEPNQIWLFEPICTASGTCVGTGNSNFQTINGSGSTLKDAVIHNGYVYFVNGTNLYKRKTRGVNSICEASDTGTSGCISLITSGVGDTLRVYDGVLYFTVGQTALKHLDTTDNVVSNFNINIPPASVAQHGGFTIFENSSNSNAITIVYVKKNVVTGTWLEECTSSGCNERVTMGGDAVSYATLYTTTNRIYFYAQKGGTFESYYYIANFTALSVDIITDLYSHTSRAYVGSRSTIGLKSTATTYETFSSDEVGVDSLATIPPELEYSTASIESLKTTYYNRSDIFLQYSVVISELATANLLLDTSDYRWMVTMTDPNSVSKDVYLSPQCTFDSLLDTSCETTETLQFAWPAPGWLIGTWSADLYEINTVTSHRGLVASSSTFTVLNTTVENQSVINPPTIPITSGTAPQTLTIIDGIVSLMGLGVNAITKLLFAMIIIGIMATVGLVYGNGNVAMVFAFIPYAFFTLIEYIPKWIFIIAIILIAIVSRAFR